MKKDPPGARISGDTSRSRRIDEDLATTHRHDDVQLANEPGRSGQSCSGSVSSHHHEASLDVGTTEVTSKAEEFQPRKADAVTSGTTVAGPTYKDQVRPATITPSSVPSQESSNTSTTIGPTFKDQADSIAASSVSSQEVPNDDDMTLKAEQFETLSRRDGVVRSDTVEGPTYKDQVRPETIAPSSVPSQAPNTSTTLDQTFKDQVHSATIAASSVSSQEVPNDDDMTLKAEQFESLSRKGGAVRSDTVEGPTYKDQVRPTTIAPSSVPSRTSNTSTTIDPTFKDQVHSATIIAASSVSSQEVCNDDDMTLKAEQFETLSRKDGVVRSDTVEGPTYKDQVRPATIAPSSVPSQTSNTSTTIDQTFKDQVHSATIAASSVSSQEVTNDDDMTSKAEQFQSLPRRDGTASSGTATAGPTYKDQVRPATIAPSSVPSQESSSDIDHRTSEQPQLLEAELVPELVQAQLVPSSQLESERNDMLQQKLEEQALRNKCICRWTILVGAMVLIMLASVCGSGNCKPKSTNETKIPFDAPFDVERANNIAAFINSVTVETVQYPAPMNRTRSSEEEALQWIIEEDLMQLDETEQAKLVQRFVIASLLLRGKSLLEVDECEWDGIQCDTNGTVTGIRLQERALQGTIPVNIGLLSQLDLLDLSENALGGLLPSSLYDLNALLFLSLANNEFTGEIPAELGTLPELRFLSLARNDFLSTIPPEISSLSHLAGLYLNNNRLVQTIPTQLGLMSNLNSFDVSNNILIGEIPSTLGKMTSLEFLSFANNNIDGTIPTNFGQFSIMEAFLAHSNELTGTIPDDMFKLQNMEFIFLSRNLFSGELPSDLSAMRSLKHLDLSLNMFNSTIPSVISPTVTSLGFAHNNFHGTLASGLFVLSDLESINFQNNLLTGTIPAEIGGLTALKILRLFSNMLTGSIPIDLFSLTSLNELNLENNQINGTLPTEIGNLLDVNLLIVGNNQITGTIPSEISNLAALEDFELRRNSLSGPIPLALSGLTKLKNFFVDENRLTGIVPTSIGVLTDLEWLILHRNNFTGTIPTDIGLLTSLESLTLSINQLSGTVPSNLAALTNLFGLFLHENRLSGKLPTGLPLLSNLIQLGLRNNQFTGTIPAGISSWNRIETAWLQNNMFVGVMPLCERDILVPSSFSLIVDCNVVQCDCCTNCCPAAVGNISTHETCTP